MGFLLYYINNIINILKEKRYLKIQDLRKEGIKKLKEYNIDDSSTKIDMLLQYLLNISKIDIIVNSEKVV